MNTENRVAENAITEGVVTESADAGGTESMTAEGAAFESAIVENTVAENTTAENTTAENTPVEKRRITSSLPAKVVAFFVLTIMAGIVIVGVIAVDVLIEWNFYARSLGEIETTYLRTYFPQAQPQGSGSGQIEAVPVAAQFGLMLIEIGFALRYWIYAILFLAVALAITAFIFLLCGAGHWRGSDEIKGFALGIPFDLLTCVFAIAGGIVFDLFVKIFYDLNIYYPNGPAALFLLVVGFVIAVVVFTGWCMSFAARVKQGSWWRNTVIWRILLLAWRLLKACGRALVTLAQGTPLIWKTILIIVALTLVEFFGILLAVSNGVGELLLLWFIEKLLVVPAVLYLALVLRRLQKGGAALAAGDLSHHVNTKPLLGDFRQHGEHLNSIALGMARTVEERMRGERLKTELITNVSHDLKTPLTSIINYTGLICQEHSENERITEYAEVLQRQSERLHRLLEGLIEASRASTGAIEIALAPCEVGILLAQTVGEYEQHAQKSGLELVTRQPEHPVRIMADGRHLWRVFDNLMSNACKYSQSGTRVYLTVEESDGVVTISFKNTSRYALDISPQELLERFARGDSSRSTEGTGLGLSIAQSLTELQNGQLELAVDGDLFKAILRFRAISLG